MAVKASGAFIPFATGFNLNGFKGPRRGSHCIVQIDRAEDRDKQRRLSVSAIVPVSRELSTRPATGQIEIKLAIFQAGTNEPSGGGSCRPNDGKSSAFSFRGDH